MLGSRVVSADEGGLTLAAGGRLAGRTLVWAGGLIAPPLLALSSLPTARNGQVQVDDYLQPAGYPDIYVIGDAARVRNDSANGVLNPTAQAAIGQGRAAAYNIVARREGWPRRPYTPTDRGQVISLGSASGVADLLVPLAGRKVAALKALVAEAYRFEISGTLPFIG